MEKQKNGKVFFIICTIIGIVLPLFVGVSTFNGLGIVLGILVSVAIGIIALVGARQEISRKLCKNCKRQFTMDDIGYEEVTRNTKRYKLGENANPAKTIQEKLFAKLRFTCHCPNCQNTQQFEQKYTLATLYWDGHEKEHDVERTIEKDIKRPPTGKANALAILFSSVVFTVILAIIGSALV